MIKFLNYKIKEWHQNIVKNILASIEEMRTIIRNRDYMKRYPKLFAIFSLIEHEQSPQIFEVNHDDFMLIKNKILHDTKINNHHILDALRGLFQNVYLHDKNDEIKNKILHYIYTELRELLKVNNRYYDPIIKAIVRGFPLVLNYNDYAILKLLLQHKSRRRLKLLKYILDKENFVNFFIDNSDVIEIIIASNAFNNKAAYMILIKYLRQNNLFNILFSSNFKKIICADNFKKHGFEYSVVALSYYEDRWLSSAEKIAVIEEFFYKIFSHHLKIEQKQRIENYNSFIAAIAMSRHLGYKNFMIEEILNKVVLRFLENKNNKDRKKKSLTKLKKYIKILDIIPSSIIRPRGFFSVMPMAVEEYWMLRLNLNFV